MQAIAYLRWSSDDHTAGNSLDRQTANAKAYCDRAELALDSQGKQKNLAESRHRGQSAELSAVSKKDSFA
jgi:DNA invertase Pin-like site-specific DNA recombinase